MTRRTRCFLINKGRFKCYRQVVYSTLQRILENYSWLFVFRENRGPNCRVTVFSPGGIRAYSGQNEIKAYITDSNDVSLSLARHLILSGVSEVEKRPINFLNFKFPKNPRKRKRANIQTWYVFWIFWPWDTTVSLRQQQQHWSPSSWSQIYYN